MPILNYTTTISATKTAGEIQTLLVKKGAKSVRLDYENGEPQSIEFETNTALLGHQFYRYAPNVAAVLTEMKGDPKVSRSQCTTDQARRVAWRIEKDWLIAQFAKIEAMSVPIEQIMMPYMLSVDGRTLFEMMVEQRKALPEGAP